MKNHFNLIDEPWIPIEGCGQVSLRQIYSNSELRGLGGNSIQKIAVFKLLLAISQAAATPDNSDEWQQMGTHGLMEKCQIYLDQWYDKFYLYGDQPFLQMPAVEGMVGKRTADHLSKAKTPGKIREAEARGMPKSMGTAIYPDIPSDNNTQLSRTLMPRFLADADKALFVVTLMNFAFAGKRVEADLVTLGGTKLGNRYSAKAGPSQGGFWGHLHSYIFAESLQDSIWLNILSYQDIDQKAVWSSGVGIPVWEKMPASELDNVAAQYKNSYLSTLIALSRFVLLRDGGIYYCDGLIYPSVREGWYEPSLTIDMSGKDVRVKYVDPDRRPWRELDALLSFAVAGTSTGFECNAIKLGLERARDNFSDVYFWSGGLRTSSSSGDQSVKQRDDFVGSTVWLETEALGEPYVETLKQEMAALDTLAKALYATVFSYYKKLSADGRDAASSATTMFWQLCETNFQALVDSCDTTEESMQRRQTLRQIFAGYQHQAYDKHCQNVTARQIDAWAKYRPHHYKYTSMEVA